MVSREDMLMFMVGSGDYEAVKAVVQSKVNLNFQSKEGVTPLLGAIEKGEYRMAKLFLENGADCNGRGRLTEWHYAMGIPRQNKVLEWTPLINAALYGHPNIVELLIQHGADINFRDINGRSALNSAIQQGHEKCAEILILNGAQILPVDIGVAAVVCPNIDFGELLRKQNELRRTESRKLKLPLLHTAAMDGDRERLKDLIRKGADLNSLDSSGKTPLHVVIECGYLGCAELLIKKGADVNVRDKEKCTVLHLAASLGITKIIPLLIENGAIVDARGNDELTPLHFAVFHSFPTCVKQLLYHGASVNAVFADGKTALHIAVSKSSECIEILMKENADIFAKDNMGICPLELSIELGLDAFKLMFPGNYNVVNADGITPLHIAANCCKTECLELMIRDGSDVNVRTNAGDTPLHFACSQGDIAKKMLHELDDSKRSVNVELLINAGVNVNEANNLGITSIHVCARNGLFSALKVLGDFGAELNLPGGDKNQTPLLYAAETGSVLCCKYLIEKGAAKTVTNVEKCTALMLAAKNAHFKCVKFLLENDVPLWLT